MKILKTLKSLNGVTLAAALAAVLVSANANAEFVLGGDVGYASNTATVEFRAADHGDNSSSFGVFGQYIFAAQPGDAGFGVHVGHATESGEVTRGCLNPGVKCAFFDFENTLDILGVYRTAEFGKGWSGLVMLGYSRREVQFEYVDGISFRGPDRQFGTEDDIDVSGLNDSATHSGYKIAAGVQKIFRDGWSMQAQVQYADYGEETYLLQGSETEYDMTSLGLRIGIAHHF